jgi:hypothetical protein
MKKLLLVSVLAVALLGLLASPAFAYQATLTPQPNSAYVVPAQEWFGGNIVNFTDSTGNWSTDEFVPGGPVTIPSGYNVWILWGWGSPIRGTVQNIPSDLLSSFSVSGDNGYSWALSAAAAQPLWTDLYNAGTGPAFNKANASIWQRDWYVDLGPLADGSYAGSTIQTYTRPVTDSTFTGDTWVKHAQQKPIKLAPGTSYYTFAFIVGQ